MKKMIFSIGLVAGAFAQEETSLCEGESPQGIHTSNNISENFFPCGKNCWRNQEKTTKQDDLYWEFPEGTTIEARLSCFIPQSALLRSVYQYCGIDYQLEGTIPAWKPLQLWWALDYFYKSGKSQGLAESTSLQIFPITLGLKALFRTGWAQPYCGLGMRYFFVWTHNHSPYVLSSLSKNGMGGVAEIGALIEPLRHFIIDLFMAYSYKPMHTEFLSSSNIRGQSLNVGGWHFGGGFGYQF